MAFGARFCYCFGPPDRAASACGRCSIPTLPSGVFFVQAALVCVLRNNSNRYFHSLTLHVSWCLGLVLTLTGAEISSARGSVSTRFFAVCIPLFRYFSAECLLGFRTLCFWFSDRSLRAGPAEIKAEAVTDTIVATLGYLAS